MWWQELFRSIDYVSGGERTTVTFTMAVPGGTLYRIATSFYVDGRVVGGDEAMVFVPDPPKVGNIIDSGAS